MAFFALLAGDAHAIQCADKAHLFRFRSVFEKAREITNEVLAGFLCGKIGPAQQPASFGLGWSMSNQILDRLGPLKIRGY